jgi:hypothetical protein
MRAGLSLQEKQLSEKVLRMLSGEHILLRHLQVRRFGAHTRRDVFSKLHRLFFKI